MVEKTRALNTVQHMRDAVFFEGPELGRRMSRFWILLVLASIIAAAGVVADSTATVIGAMIVAPLMTPILGTMLAVVLADRINVVRSVALVVGGAAAAIAIGYVLGLMVENPVTAATNAQVAGRVSPTLIDLLAALATGVVGAVALVRSDISDTLPGVAIAISLVPPLSVVGLTLESNAPSESLGALLLFGTNVAAILTTGVVVMAVYKVAKRARTSNGETTFHRRTAIAVIVVFFVVIAVPLTVSTYKITADTGDESEVRDVADPWAEANGWSVLRVTSTDDQTVIVIGGLPPAPPLAGLTDDLKAAGIDPTNIVVDFVLQAQLVPDETTPDTAAP